MTGDLLTENPLLGFGNGLGPGRIATTLYKGLTPAMLRAVHDGQAEQRRQLEVRTPLLGVGGSVAS